MTSYWSSWWTTEDPWAHYYEDGGGIGWWNPEYVIPVYPAIYDKFNEWMKSFRWYAEHVNVVTGMIIFLMNFYILAVIVSNQQLRSINFYPVALQAFCDMLIGQCSARYSIHSLLSATAMVEHMDGSISYSSYHYSGTVAELLRGTRLLEPKHWFMRKVFYFIYEDLNLFSTGYCLLAMAVERYILVCHPFNASALLCRRNRLICCAILTLFIISYSLMDEVCNAKGWKYCSEAQGDYNMSEIRTFTDSILLFFVPATVTSVLYTFMCVKLAKSRTKRVRNRDLTIAFFLSCLFWIILWFPLEVMKILQSMINDVRIIDFSYANMIRQMLSMFAGELFRFSPLINPIIFIFVTRDFQKPIKKLFDKMKKKFVT